MRKSVITFVAFGFLAACNSAGSGKSKTEEIMDLTKNPVYVKGLALVSQNKCFTCHTIDDPLTGPPYREVAKKYADMPDTIISHLAHKVISGGNGVWGQIFMTPHPDISEADAEDMVKYILLLKK